MKFEVGQYVIVKQLLDEDGDGYVDTSDLKELAHTLNKIGIIVSVTDIDDKPYYPIRVKFTPGDSGTNFNEKELVLIKNKEHAKVLYGGISE